MGEDPQWFGAFDVVIGPDGAVPLPWLAAPLVAHVPRLRGHALLVHAAAGNGSLEFALSLAQTFLCEGSRSGSAPLACGQCASCHMVQNQLHADLFVLLPEEDRLSSGWRISGDRADAGDADSEGKARKKASRQLRVDEIRQAVDWLANSSSRGRAKVLVIHPAEKLNLIAANALLKTLEEPPAGVRIVLTASDPAHLLPTVLSRCQRIQPAAPSSDDSLRWLRAQGVAEPEVLLRAAGGQPLRAMNMFRSGMTAAVWGNVPLAASNAQTAAFAGWPIPEVIDALMHVCHDAMRVAAGALPLRFEARALPKLPSMTALQTWLGELERLSKHSEHPWSDALLIDSLLMQASQALKSR